MRISVARAGSDIARDFMDVSTSRSCCGGRLLSVCEIASVALRLGGRSTPGGRGGIALGGGMPFVFESLTAAFAWS